MTARIHRSFEFQAGVYFNDTFYMNVYEFDVDFLVNSDDIREQNIAVDRIKFYLYECLEHAVFIQDTETTQIENFVNANMKVCILPEEPYDQIVGIMLLVKLNAIMENRLTITELAITSKMSDGVSCLHSYTENVGPFNMPGWWNDSSTKISNIIASNKKKKILKIMKPNQDWDDVMLSWQEKPILPKDSPTAEIVFGMFDNKQK